MWCVPAFHCTSDSKCHIHCLNEEMCCCLLQMERPCPGGWIGQAREGRTGVDFSPGCSNAPAVWMRTASIWTISATATLTAARGKRIHASHFQTSAPSQQRGHLYQFYTWRFCRLRSYQMFTLSITADRGAFAWI